MRALLKSASRVQFVDVMLAAAFALGLYGWVALVLGYVPPPPL